MQDRTRNLVRRGLVAMALFLATTLLLFAFTSGVRGQQQEPPQQELEATDVTDADLTQFAMAFEKVQAIRMDLQRKLTTVQDSNAATQLQQQANAEMGKAVRDNGLEIPKYNALSRVISSDKELLARFKEVQKRIAEEKEKESQE